MAGATFKGTLIQRTNFELWLDVRRGLENSTKVRGGSTLVPKLEGQIQRNRKNDKLEIELYGWIKGASLANYWTLLKELLALFDPTDGPGELVVPLEDGTTASCTALPLNVMPEAGERIGVSQRFSIQLEATDPPSWTFA